jgi:hypothetical protein
VLPFSKDANGNVHFDANAGILGSLIRGFKLPGDVMSGKVDPLSDEGMNRAADMAVTFGPTEGVGRMMAKPVTGVPSAADLKAAASQGYDAVRGMGVDYASHAVAGLADKTQKALEADGILAELAPQTHAILGKLAAAPPDSVAPIASLEAARRALGRAAGNFNNPTDQLAARRSIDALTNFVEVADPSTVVAGPATAAGNALAAARGNYAAAMRSEAIGELANNTDRRALAANSGLNADNALRSRVASLLQSDRASAGYTPAELDALETAARGTPARNALRWTGNVLGGGGGLGAVVTGGIGATAGSELGGLTGMAVGAGVPALGMGAKMVANALTRRALNRVDDMVRTRSPLFQSSIDTTPAQIMPPRNATRDVLVRALLSRGSYPISATDSQSAN